MTPIKQFWSVLFAGLVLLGLWIGYLSFKESQAAAKAEYDRQFQARIDRMHQHLEDVREQAEMEQRIKRLGGN